MTPLPEGYLSRPFAHRGLHGVHGPENGLGAISAAARQGYAVEFDVQLSADGTAMVFHDETLERMTGADGPVRARTAADLQTLVLRGSDETIPTLAQVLDALGGATPVAIEIKDQSGALGPTDGDLEAAVASELSRVEGPFAVMSFNPYTVQTMARLCPDIPRGIVACAFDDPEYADLPEDWREALRAISMRDKCEAAFISHDADDLGRDVVAAARAAGLGVLTWTIRSQEAAEAALVHADQITFEGFVPS